jgi:hypothetical protein
MCGVWENSEIILWMTVRIVIFTVIFLEIAVKEQKCAVYMCTTQQLIEERVWAGGSNQSCSAAGAVLRYCQ